jgi:hypothetical protein
MSYPGGVGFGLVADRDGVPDLEDLARELDASFEEWQEAVG